MLMVGGTVLMGVIALFIFHGFFHMEVSVAALFGAALISLTRRTLWSCWKKKSNGPR